MGRLATLAPRLRVLDTRTIRPEPKRADRELLSPEHRAWRLEVLKRAHWRCQYPGCDRRGGKGGARLFAHHIRARQDGGDPLDPNNGQALCGQHHSLVEARLRAARMAASEA